MIKYLFLVSGLFFYSQAKINQSVLICGTCKNIEKQLPKTTNIVETIGKLFADYRIILYENNSTDNTKNLLHQWGQNNSKVIIYSEDIDESKMFVNEDYSFVKSECIARARNIILDKIESPKYANFNFAIWVDMDFTIPPSYEGITEVFKTKQEWDAVFAYGVDRVGHYWDWFALRDNIDPFGPELIGHYEWYKEKQERVLKKTDDWYPVYSAFGGCGIYKKTSIKGCRYSGLVTKDLETCVKKIIEKGRNTNHPVILKYLNDIKQLKFLHKIPSAIPELTKLTDYYNTGIVLQPDTDPLIWRMNSFTYQYPATCEHVTFHASMIVNGHDKLFINPRMIFTYGSQDN